ncbi:MAG: preQ(1) synthase [Chitinivibrionales bacterium]|nr:preQ(1) synthase [Chitinivibrionales bacterium]
MLPENVTLLPDALHKGLLPELESFDCPYNTGEAPTGIIRITFPEFTCVCPKTGYPDFARIDFYYLPAKLCLELKSWKLYCNAFRMVGAFHETVSAHLFDTLTTLLKPRWALLTADFFPRGNVNTTLLFETSVPRPAGADLLIRPIALHARGFEGKE